MSYINEALTKAQKEKDKSSGNIQSVIVPAPLPDRKRGKYAPVAVVIAVVVAVAAVASVLYLWSGDNSSRNAARLATTASPPAAGVAVTSSPVPPSAGTSSAGATAVSGQPVSLPPTPGAAAPPKETAQGVYQGPPAPGTVSAGTASPPGKWPESAAKQPAPASPAQTSAQTASPTGKTAPVRSAPATGTVGLTAKRVENTIAT